MYAGWRRAAGWTWRNDRRAAVCNGRGPRAFSLWLGKGAVLAWQDAAWPSMLRWWLGAGGGGRRWQRHAVIPSSACPHPVRCTLSCPLPGAPFPRSLSLLPSPAASSPSTAFNSRAWCFFDSRPALHQAPRPIACTPTLALRGPSRSTLGATDSPAAAPRVPRGAMSES